MRTERSQRTGSTTEFPGNRWRETRFLSPVGYRRCSIATRKYPISGDFCMPYMSLIGALSVFWSQANSFISILDIQVDRSGSPASISSKSFLWLDNRHELNSYDGRQARFPQFHVASMLHEFAAVLGNSHDSVANDAQQKLEAIAQAHGRNTENVFGKELAGEPGFEPGLTESESVGLPLTYSP